MARGGRREGAGRKRGSRKGAAPFAAAPVPAPAAPRQYENAEDYLEAVVKGEVLPDRDRIAAAKAMLPYQIAKRRLPVKSDAPRQMELSKELEQEKQQLDDWKQTQRTVRLRLIGREKV